MEQLFARTGDTVEDHLKHSTIGLVTKEEYGKRRQMFEKMEQEQRLREERSREEARLRQDALRKKRIANEASKLSFSMEDEEDGDEDEDDAEQQGYAGGDWRSALLQGGNSHGASSSSDTSGVKGRGKEGEEEEEEEEKVHKRSLSQAQATEETEDSHSTSREAESTGELVPKRRKVMKAPGVDTSFLPDRYRDEELQREKSRLAEEWRQEQERIKEEPLEITYSYWDGSGHRRTTVIKKGFSIRDFLQVVKSEFKDLTRVSVDDLMYIKEDLIIPHQYTFYHLIVNKARGKSGPLFHFDVHEDIRMTVDTRVEKDESHPGKVVDRRWYERNKHVFPASRWEVYDPDKTFERYTIHGD